ncbi:MAG: 16S rRNA (cytosine(967)-C(5))-methyltransferase RsmB [Gammaproteobacteria bacterium]|nr:16S rRNA (cytosine(967)-C(5))-methyltransferase RsmB [Gammaproteobacteria bacterium]
MRQALILRARAAHVVARVLGGGALDEALRIDGERHGRHGLVDEFAIGAVREALGLGHLIDPLLKRPLKSRDADIRALLLIGLYQARHLDTPPEVAVSSAVAATEALHKGWAKGLVNAVLRAAVTDERVLSGTARNHPAWLVERLRQAWPAQWPAILAANDTRPPLTVRVAEGHGRPEILDVLAARGIDAHAHPHVATAIVVTSAGVKVAELPGFAAGFVSVQDAGAQLAAPLLDPQPGEAVLDACAAPGGKTMHLASLCPEARITAVDRDPRRLARLSENIARMRVAGSVTVRPLDLTTAAFAEPFDRILLDAPCSASGVIRRHPDIKLLRRAEDMAALTGLQRTLLDRLWTHLRPGGTLLYATCSILPEENEEQIAAFLARTAHAGELPVALPWAQARSHGRQLLPGENETDGFYYALLTKTRT